LRPERKIVLLLLAAVAGQRNRSARWLRHRRIARALRLIGRQRSERPVAAREAAAPLWRLWLWSECEAYMRANIELSARPGATLTPGFGIIASLDYHTPGIQHREVGPF
jgi:hypothetical protein